MKQTVCVIGVGYVGEHLVETFMNGYNVIGVDVNPKRIEDLKIKFSEYNNVQLQSDYSNLEHCDVFLISVPTLVKGEDIDMSYLTNVKTQLEPIVQQGALIVVESSVYVGATREIFGEFLNKGIFVGFSPERVDPGRIEPKMEDIPKVISGLNANSLNKIQHVYSKVIKNVVPVSSTECAEMCKLYENCFRMINIAYVNEISDMCNQIGINPYEMISASSTKPFGFMPFYPGIGVGGHCIPVNPYYLFKNGNLPVLKFSTELMNNRPKKKAHELLHKYKEAENILICGIGFKKGESLLTNSPAFSLYNQLKALGKNVIVFDPISQENPLNLSKDICFVSNENLKQSLRKNDLVIVAHSYANEEIKKHQKNGGKVEWFISQN
jgi:nucleotide sugar dehydrogenase